MMRALLRTGIAVVALVACSRATKYANTNTPTCDLPIAIVTNTWIRPVDVWTNTGTVLGTVAINQEQRFRVRADDKLSFVDAEAYAKSRRKYYASHAVKLRYVCEAASTL